MSRKLTNKEIEQMSLDYVIKYLKGKGKNPERLAYGADILCDGVHIEVKGCMKRETNLRVSEQTLKEVEEKGKLKQGSFFIFYVFDMESKPKLMIFDYETYKKYELIEKKHLIQPFSIGKKTNQEFIDL
jgi:hypothetical protein